MCPDNRSGFSHILPLSPFGLERLCRFILRQTGLVICDHQRDNLVETVQRACERFGFPTGDEYLQALEESHPCSPEMEYLIAGITVGESYFLRDPAQIDFIRNSILPEIISRKREAGVLSLRIWSAGCSGGQEIYTLAMILDELLPDRREWTVHLLGTDINTGALAQAVKGEYSEWSLRATPEHVRNRYFDHAVDRTYRIRPLLRNAARFVFLNLADDRYPSIMTDTHAMDLILCRNVFIYFDAEVIAQVMSKFAAALVPEGYLMLGAADLRPGAIDGLRLCEIDRMPHYRRADSGVSLGMNSPSGLWRGNDVEAQPALLTSAAQRTEARREQAEGGRDDATAQIIRLLRDGRWQEASAAIDDFLARYGKTAMMLQFKAKVLCNMGESKQALELCRESIVLDATDEHTYFITALALLEMDELREAEKALRKTIFLNRYFVEAHYHLGLLLFRLGQETGAIKSLHNALAAVERCDPAQEVHDASGMTMGRLAEILRKEVAVYEGGNRRDHV